AELIQKLYSPSTASLSSTAGDPFPASYYSLLPKAGFGDPLKVTDLLPASQEARYKTLLFPAERGFFSLTHSDTRFSAGPPDTRTEKMSDFFTRPRRIIQTSPELEMVSGQSPRVKASTFSDPVIGRLGNNLVYTPVGANTFASYSTPREYDGVCSGNNSSTSPSDTWNQLSETASAPGGFTFELNAVNMMNTDLKVNSDFLPVYFRLKNGIDFSGGPLSTLSYCAFETPNVTPILGFTYDSVKTPAGVVVTAAKSAEKCTWKPVPDDASILEMQPIPVYYKKTDTLVRKFVYHRIRFRWTPRDGLDHTQDPTPGANERDKTEEFIKNRILSGFQVISDRFKYKLENSPGGDIDIQTYPAAYLDQTTYNQDFPLYAKREEFPPCFKESGLFPTGDTSVNVGSADPLALGVPAPTSTWKFWVEDENYPRLSVAANAADLTKDYGRFRAEMLSAFSSDSIQSDSFARKALFIQNNSPAHDAGDPKYALSTPGIALWYARSDSVPRLRLDSKKSQTPWSSGAGTLANIPFRLDLVKRPLVYSGDTVWDEVILLTRSNDSSETVINLHSIGFDTCTSVDQIRMEASMKYLLLPGHCGMSLSHTKGDVLYNGADYSLKVQFVLNPSINENGGYGTLLASKNLTIDYLPFFYGPPSDIEQTIFAFEITPINTMKLTRRVSEALLPEYLEPGTLTAIPAPNPKNILSTELLPSRTDP
ncbi:MAG: hypothetical protein EBX52_11940, partial [Proteobacteria bacterium]|nr:hypothetical protein [Pseudomonadota bacterium]